MTQEEINNLHLVFTTALEKFSNDRGALKQILILEEKINKLIKDESSRNEDDQ